ncbi:MAG: transposase [Bacteroidales bacterium]|nr:transposase [Candidatus Colicola faecequi]
MAADNTTDQWQWQEPGHAWHGRGIYHMTLTQTDRSEGRLGTLVDSDDPESAHVAVSPLGRMVIEELQASTVHHPEIEIWAYQIMPDHLHAIIHVSREMPCGIMTVVRGFWQSTKRRYREWLSSIMPDDIRRNEQYELPGNLFGEMPFVRPMSRKGQLNNMIRYVHDNPRRLAVKRLHPGFFRVMHGVETGETTMDAVGNMLLLQQLKRQTVHVRRTMVEEAEHGNNAPLRDYMNGCILAARQGTLLISPFISPHERMVREQLLREQLPFVQLMDNGFPPLYKPDGVLITAVAEGRVLLLAPQEYTPDKRTISREECRQLNALADQIAAE